jgi:hypothetical protein
MMIYYLRIGFKTCLANLRYAAEFGHHQFCREEGQGRGIAGSVFGEHNMAEFWVNWHTDSRLLPDNIS